MEGAKRLMVGGVDADEVLGAEQPDDVLANAGEHGNPRVAVPSKLTRRQEEKTRLADRTKTSFFFFFFAD